MSYHEDAKYDADNMIGEYKDEIIEKLVAFGEASDDLYNDYVNGDSYQHENHVDKYYDLSEAAEVLDELSRYEETDTGLWQGLEPRRAIGAQAAYTYGNAVYSMWCDMIGDINSNFTDNLSDAEDDIEEKVGEYTVEQCRQYIVDNPDCDFDIDAISAAETHGELSEEVDLDDAKEAIIEHQKERVAKRVAAETIDAVTVQ